MNIIHRKRVTYESPIDGLSGLVRCFGDKSCLALEPDIGKSQAILTKPDCDRRSFKQGSYSFVVRR